jgi:hypothetical protein
MPIGFPVAPAPAAPAPTPPAPAAPAAAELNESLKKLADSVDTLTKMVRQQTKILECHENRLDDLEKKVQGLLDAQKGKTPGKTTSINTTHAPPAPEAVERIHAPLGAPIRVGVLPADDRK